MANKDKYICTHKGVCPIKDCIHIEPHIYDGNHCIGSFCPKLREFKATTHYEELASLPKRECVKIKGGKKK